MLQWSFALLCNHMPQIRAESGEASQAALV
jgi:hypothetical protein